MNLPRPLFLRLRRRVRRSLAMSPFSFIGQKWSPIRVPDPPTPQPDKFMRFLFFLTLAAILFFFALGMSSCVETTVKDPVTGIETTTKAVDPLAAGLAGQALDTYVTLKAAEAQRAREVERSSK